MHSELLLAEEIAALRRRLAAVEAQEMTQGVHYASAFLPSHSTLADSQQFNAGSGGVPTGWTVVDAPVASSLTNPPGYWYIAGTSANTTWQYKKQMAALTTPSIFNSFSLGPVLFRDGRWANDMVYLFGIYADNAGTPNQNVFLRCNLTWDSTAGFWKVRSERKDGATETDGSWFNLYQIPVAQPIWMRLVVQTAATILGRVYVGSSPLPITHTLLQSANANYTWGTPWLQVDLASRGSGIDCNFLMGGINRSTDA